MPTVASFGIGDAALVIVLVASAVTDVRTGRIYNAVTYPGLATGLALAGLGVSCPLQSSALGLVAGALPLYVFFAAGMMGGGDVKLMAAVGALKGFPFILTAMFYSVFLAGVCAAVVLIWRGHVRHLATDVATMFRHAWSGAPVKGVIEPRGGSFPFGLAICIGTLIALALSVIA